MQESYKYVVEYAHTHTSVNAKCTVVRVSVSHVSVYFTPARWSLRHCLPLEQAKENRMNHVHKG